MIYNHLSPFRKYRGILLATVAVPLFSGILMMWHGMGVPNGGSVIAFGMLVALAALVVGGLTGFLFGIPRALQRTDNVPADQTDYAVNTNLEQISDWLTKLLIGVGLVQLGQIPDGISRLSNAIAPGFGGESWSPVLAGVICVLFVTWGFFLGYLVTRTYLTAALRDFDGLRPEQVVSVMEKTENKLSHVVADPARETSDLRPPIDRPVPPTHNREPLEDPLPIPWFDESWGLVSLRACVLTMLSQLVQPARTESFQGPSDIVAVLTRRGVLDPPSAEALMQLFDAAAHVDEGTPVPPRMLRATTALGGAILERLSQLGSTGAARFEQHVLSTIANGISSQWDIRRDVPIATDRSVLSDNSDPSRAIARVDALLVNRRTHQVVAIEVRARIRDYQNVVELMDWLDHTPPDIPVIVVVPNMSDRMMPDLELNRRTAARDARLLIWDTQADDVARIIEAI